MKLKITLISSFLVFIVLLTSAQEIWPTPQGDLRIYPIRHAGMVLEWNGLTIYIDPVGDAVVYNRFSAPDLVFITHSHGDHLSMLTLDGINAEGVSFFVPQEVADKLDEKFKSKMQILANGDRSKIMDIVIECVPAYNYPVTDLSRHIKGVGNGYVLTLGEKRIYISGDTGNIPEMNKLKNIDLALLCMNLPYTMDVDDASKAIIAIRPKVVYPYHFRSQGGFSDVEKFKSLVAEANAHIEVRILDWYAKD